MEYSAFKNSSKFLAFTLKPTLENSLKYFYIYIDGIGMQLSRGSREKSFRMVSNFAVAVTGISLEKHLVDSIDIPLFPYFYDTLCDAEKILRGEDVNQRKKIHYEMMRQIFSALLEF